MPLQPHRLRFETQSFETKTRNTELEHKDRGQVSNVWDRNQDLDKDRDYENKASRCLHSPDQELYLENSN